MEQKTRRFFRGRNLHLLVAMINFGGAGCILSRGQRYHHFTTQTPLPPEHYLIRGFVGGRERWDNDKRGVRERALELRSMNLSGVQVETIENKKRKLAIRLIRTAFDGNHHGALDWEERASVG